METKRKKNEKKVIKVVTNLIAGGWSAKDLETGIGGSEEKLIEWAREMAKVHDVTIYMNGEHGDFDGVKYRAHRDFVPYEEHDVFVSFKNAQILQQSINAEHIFHWSMEIEPPFPNFLINKQVDYLDKIFTISNYHKSRLFPQNDKLETMYLWADFEKLEKNKINDGDKEKGTMLYSSSYDRGLEELLHYWPIVKERLGLKKLYITYGWDFIANQMKYNPRLRDWKSKMDQMMGQEGVEHLGRLSNDEMCKMYWKAEYWALPLSNPDSELFCINAIKAQYCGAKPVVRLAGALQETVNELIPFEFIIEGREFKNLTQKQIEANKKHAEKFNLPDAINKWNQLIS